MCNLIQYLLKIGGAFVVAASIGCATKATNSATGNTSPISPNATYPSKSNSRTGNRTAGDSHHELRAKLSEGNNVDLSWTDYAPAAAGYFVEYTNYLRDPFIPIAAFSRGTTSCRHPDLMPGTPFLYRIRPFFGHATTAVEIVTGKAPSEETAGEFYDPKPVPSGDKSLKVAATEAAASDLTATLPSPNQVQLNWKDNSRDEDGYLVEVADPNGDFKVCALLDPNITSHVIGGLPPETRCFFRVRAFYCGRPSNNARIMTRPDTREKRQTETSQPILNGS